jgi:hypothetical protein
MAGAYNVDLSAQRTTPETTMTERSQATRPPASYEDRRKPAVLWTMALISAANALWMLADPAGWFNTLPGVADTGPLNVHLVRDVGCAYLTVAVALAFAARVPRAGFPALVVTGTFLGLHALLHVWDVAAGRLPASHALGDAPLVFLPAVLTLALTYWLKPEWR